MASENKFGWAEFITGFAAGSLISLLFSRKNLNTDMENLKRRAEEIRNRLIEKAKNISNDITGRSQKFIESSKKFAEGKYTGTIESLEKEYHSIKYAIHSAIDNYKRSSGAVTSPQNDNDDLFIDFDEEKLPKFIGMGRRKR